MEDFQFTAPDFSGGPAKFIKDVRSELNKVIWPTKQQVIKMTLMVIAVSLAVGAYIGGLDWSFTKLMEIVLQN